MIEIKEGRTLLKGTMWQLTLDVIQLGSALKELVERDMPDNNRAKTTLEIMSSSFIDGLYLEEDELEQSVKDRLADYLLNKYGR